MSEVDVITAKCLDGIARILRYSDGGVAKDLAMNADLLIFDVGAQADRIRDRLGRSADLTLDQAVTELIEALNSSERNNASLKGAGEELSNALDAAEAGKPPVCETCGGEGTIRFAPVSCPDCCGKGGHD